MKKKYDYIVIGGGHNGLTVAAYLAKKSSSVCVLEKSATLGGLASGEEFHPSYRTTGLMHDTSNVRKRVIDELGLKKQGLKVKDHPADIFAPSTEGKGILLSNDPKKSFDEIAAYSKADAESYKKYRSFFDRIRPFVAKVFDKAPPNVYSLNFHGLWDIMKKGVTLRFLGKKDMMEMLRIGPMCVADWLNEWFETDVLKTMLAGPAIYGTWCGPWSPSTNSNLIVYEAMAHTQIEGGPQALINSLEKTCKSRGVDIFTDQAVQQIQVSNGQTTGVLLASGETIESPAIISSADPKTTFLNLLDPDDLPFRLETRVSQFRTRGTTAKLNLALSKPLEFDCRPGFQPEFIRISETLDDLERAFDAVKYRDFSVAPALDIHVPTVSSPELAPSGHAVASIMIHFAAYDLKDGWNDGQKERLAEAAITVLEKYVSGIRQNIVAKEIMSPVDLEEKYSVSQGHIHHGEHAADQLLMRPTPETAEYKTPIKGLFLGGSGSHPGGGITCAPGSLAADAVLHS